MKRELKISLLLMITTAVLGCVQPPVQEETFVGEFIFSPMDESNDLYNGSANVVLIPSEIKRYDFMKATYLSDGVKLPFGVRYLTLEDNTFKLKYLSGKKGDIFTLCGYYDNTPQPGEDVSFCEPLLLSGFSSNRWSWGFTNNINSAWFRWQKYAEIEFISVTGEPVTNIITTYPRKTEDELGTWYNGTAMFVVESAQPGRNILDGGLYLEALPQDMPSIKQITTISDNGYMRRNKDYMFYNTYTLPSDDYRRTASPRINEMQDSIQYFMGAFDPYSDMPSDRYRVEIDYNFFNPQHNVEYYISGVENLQAKTFSNGHYPFKNKLKLVVNFSRGIE